MKTADLFLQTLASIDEKELRNRLLLIDVREIAIACLHLNLSERIKVARLLPKPKSERLRSELAFLEKLDVRYALYAKIAEKVVGHLRGQGDVRHASWLRPKAL